VTALLRAELSRALSRRLVRVLIGAAVAAIAFAGVMVFLHTEKFDVAARERARTELEVDLRQCMSESSQSQCRLDITLAQYDKSLYLTDLWPTNDDREPVLGIAIMFLAFGGLLAAASVVAAEFRSGMLGTLLTWEPRRVRVAVARVMSAALAAVVIAFVLQVIFIGALLPSMLMHGGTTGADADWLRGLLAAMGRGAAFTGVAAVVGASLAFIGRNTAVALGVTFVYLNFVENAVRVWRPGLGRWLIVDNAGAFLMGPQPDVVASPFPVVVLLLYAFGLLALGVAIFRRRDIPGVG
jgi:ABC-2 type transport system permease protein